MNRTGSMAVRAASRSQRSTAPVAVTRSAGLPAPLVLLLIVGLVFAFVMMRLEVRRDQLSDRIQRQQIRVEQLRGDVARLNANLATATSLNSVRQWALDNGMVDPAPEQQPEGLTVVFSREELRRVRHDGDGARLGIGRQEVRP